MDAASPSPAHAGPVEPTLDDQQRAVVALPTAASAMVVGAPGTGKTTALVARVRALADRGTPLDDMVVLTASRQTATALRDRLGVAVGRATSGPLAHSVASFAFRLVRAADVRAGAEPPRLLTGGDEDAIVRDLLAGDAEDEASGAGRWPHWLTADVRSTRGFRGEVRAFLAECLTLGIGPDALAALAETTAVPTWAPMASFFRDYLRVRARMRAAHRDAASLVREAAGLLRADDPAALAAFAGTRMILVDDAQELTRGGIELLDACRRHGVAIVAFGDPDVSAGAFRGAVPETFARLTAQLGAVHVLATAHRGDTTIVDLVRTVTAHIGAAGGVAHRQRPSGHPAGDSVRVLRAASPAEESDVIARLLRERHVHDGVAWADCAVIAHDTRQVTRLEHELAARDVPTRAGGPGPALGALRCVQDILGAIELAAADPDRWTADDVSAAMCGAVGGIDSVQLRRVRQALRREEVRLDGIRGAGELLVSATRHPVEFDVAAVPEARRAARFARVVADVRAGLERGDSTHQVLWTVWSGAGLAERWGRRTRGTGPGAAQARRDTDAVVALFQAAKRFDERDDTARADPLLFVQALRDSDVAQDRLEARADAASVTVLTPAAALGCEFDTVVIAGVQDGVWPNTRLRGSVLETWRLADAVAHAPGEASATRGVDRRRAALHDELRLFARAASRARARLVVMAVDDDDAGPSELFDLLPEATPPDGLTGAPLSLRGLVARYRRTLTDGYGAPAHGTDARVVDGRADGARRAHAAGQLALLADAGVPGADPTEWYGVGGPSSTAALHDLAIEDVRVSPSHLATLEACQLDWVIGDLGGDSANSAAGVGTVIHAALESTGGGDEQALWDAVLARWGELDFDAPWLERAERTRARDLVRRLHLYVRRFGDAGGRLVQAELHFEVPVPVHGAAHGAVVGGYIDRVELTGDGAVVIVDLKTGGHEPQTDAKVADNPQLAAYQLAFESGSIAGVAGSRAGGAKLLVLRPSAEGKDYAEPWQPPFTDDTRTAFLDRVRAAAGVMTGSSFTAPFEQHCRDEYSYGLCRIHTIAAVSAP